MPIVFQPPLVTMLVVLSAWLIHALLGPWPTIVRVTVLGGILVALGFLFLMWARILFTSRNTTLFVGKPSTHLVCDGPFRCSRNPMYVGVLVFLMGLALWVGTGHKVRVRSCNHVLVRSSRFKWRLTVA